MGEYVAAASAAGVTVTFSKPATYGGRSDAGTGVYGGQIPGLAFVVEGERGRVPVDDVRAACERVCMWFWWLWRLWLY